jgi:hypothetical protein
LESQIADIPKLKTEIKSLTDRVHLLENKKDASLDSGTQKDIKALKK